MNALNNYNNILLSSSSKEKLVDLLILTNTKDTRKYLANVQAE